MRKKISIISIVIAIIFFSLITIYKVMAIDSNLNNNGTTIKVSGSIQEKESENILHYEEYTEEAKSIYDIFKDLDEDRLRGNEITVSDLNSKKYLFCGAKGWPLPDEVIGTKVYARRDTTRSNPISVTQDFDNRRRVYENLPATTVDIAGLYTSSNSLSAYSNDEYYSRNIYLHNQAGILTAKIEEINSTTTNDRDSFLKAAYVLAHEKTLGNHNNDYIQIALWMLGKPINVGNIPEKNAENKESYEKAEALVQEAEMFLKNRKEVEAQNGYTPTVADTNVELSYNISNGEILIGPFEVNYVRNFINTNGEKISFSEITDAILYDTDGNEIDSNRWSFEYNHIHDYLIGDENYAFPDSGEEFYIKIINLDGSIKGVKSLKFKFKDTYADAKYYRLSGLWVQEVIWSNSTNYDAETKMYTHMLYSTARFNKESYKPYQDILILEWAKIMEKEYELIITFKTDTPPNSPPPPDIPFTTELGGKVWLDIPLNKESTVEGTYQEGYEKLLEGIEVTLYTKRSPSTPVQINGVTNPTKTDKNGEYLFSNLPITDEYFVQFTYNGMKYEPTEYLAGGSLSDYKQNPNNSIYDNNSKALEEASLRKAFNNKFAEIIPGYTASGIQLQYETKNGISTLITERNGAVLDDFKMTATTSPNLYYPLYTTNNVGANTRVINGVKYQANYPYMYHINLGLKEREYADLAIKSDTDSAIITIKNQTPLTYTYPRRTTEDVTFDISGRGSDYYSQTNEQEINKSDYDWKYNTNTNYNGYYTAEDELQVFVQYRIILKNQSQKSLAQITELVNYFDDDFTYAQRYNKYTGITSWVKNGDETKEVTWYPTNMQYNGYVGMATNSLADIKIEKNTSVELYIVFQVNKDANGILMDEGQKGKENITEITKYKFINDQGNAAGLIDFDSAPGNAVPGNTATYEDDTDSAPLFKLVFDKSEGNTLGGYVWEDYRTVQLDNLQKIGNGEKEADEPYIDNVRVELIEVLEKEGSTPVEFVKSTTRTSNGGKYQFTNLETGVYKVRFVYGDYDQLKIDTKYNGHDFKATSYQKTIEEQTIKNAKPTEVVLTLDVSGSMSGSTIESVKSAATSLVDALFETCPTVKIGLVTFNSGARTVLGMSNDKQSIKNAICSLVAGGGTDIAAGINTSIPVFDANSNTNKVMVLFTDGGSAVEPARQALINCQNSGILPISVLTSNRTDIFGTSDNPTAGKVYAISNADIVRVFEEDIFDDILENNQIFLRNVSYATDAQTRNDGELNRADVITYSKILTNINGTVLHAQNSSDLLKLAEETAMQAVTDTIRVRGNKEIKIKELNLGLEERPKAELQVEETVEWIKVKLNNEQQLVDTQKDVIGVLKTPESDVVHLDTEYVHGATVTIKYNIKIKNTGEVDTLLNYFSTGSSDIITNKADKLYLYLQGNPVYRQEDNSVNWVEVTDLSILDSNVKKYIEEQNITVLTTNEFDVELYPEITGKTSSIEKSLIVSKVITPEIMENEDLVYISSAEIVQSSNDAGRRDYEAIPGNYKPGTTITEHDSDFARTTKISTPFGEARIYYTLIAVIAVMLGTGIVVIKKKVLG